MSDGWVCPKCGQVWAPWVARCSCTVAPIRPPLPSSPFSPPLPKVTTHG